MLTALLLAALAGIQIDGSTEWIEDDVAFCSGTTPLSYAGWVIIDDLTNAHCPYSTPDKDVGNHWWFVAARGDISDNVQACCRDGAGNNCSTSSGTYSEDVWQHIAAVFTSSTSRTVYLNGVAATAETTSCTPSGLDRTSFGRIGDSSPGCFMTGTLGVQAIWCGTLIAADVLALAANVHPSKVRPDILVSVVEPWDTTSPAIDNWSDSTWTLAGTPTAADSRITFYGFGPMHLGYPVPVGGGGSEHPWFYRRRQ